MKQSVLLSYWPTLPPIARPAPWQQALSPREKQPYRATPPYFSLMIPSPFPNYKRALIYQCESMKRYKEKTKHTTFKYTSAVTTTHVQVKKVCILYRTQIEWDFKSDQNESHSCMTCKTGPAFSHNTTGLKMVVFLIILLAGHSA